MPDAYDGRADPGGAEINGEVGPAARHGAHHGLFLNTLFMLVPFFSDVVVSRECIYQKIDN